MAQRPRIALFPGTFDPLTNGHLDVIQRASALFDKLVVAVSHNPMKRQLFDMDERLDMIRQLLDKHDNIDVDAYDCLTVDYARQIDATAIVRGLRNVTDLNFEFQLALTNRAVADIETVFIMTGETNAFTSSSLIRQIAAAGDVERLHRLLPPLVLDALKKKKTQLGPKMSIHYDDAFKE